MADARYLQRIGFGFAAVALTVTCIAVIATVTFIPA
jgi:hypothetical protein